MALVYSFCFDLVKFFRWEWSVKFAMAALILHLNIPAEKMIGYYRGEVKTVRARATNGQTIQFPASALQKFILPDGIRGRFRIEFDENFKFIGLTPLSDTE